MTRKVLMLLSTCAALGLQTLAVQAQDSVLAELYGRGVHAYNSHRYQQAHELLTQAIDLGSKDPRCFYFRGLSYLGMGHTEAAKLDYDMAAMLEAKGGARIYPVSRSLQRIQGAKRLMLEKHRRAARLAVRAEKLKIQRARYEAQQRSEQDVLRDPNRKPSTNADDLVGPPRTQTPNDPFAGPAETPEVAPERAKPTEITPSTSENTAGEPAQPAADEMSEPAEDPLGGTPTEDPFGDPPPAGDDPFGGGDSADDPFKDDSTDDPFKDDSSSSEDDPFGGL